MRLLAYFLLLISCIACDPQPPPLIATSQPATTPAAARVRVQRVTSLPAGRLTHLAPDGASHLFWIQEAEQANPASAQPGQQVLFVMNDGGLPTPTRMSNASVLTALGRGAAPGASGQIQSLVFGVDGQLYFYFAGGTRREVLSAFGSFTPGSDQIRIIADTSRLKSDSSLGDSIGLARGTVIRSGDLIWLWLRHQDGYAMLSLNVRRPALGLKRPFEKLTGNAAAKLRLVSPQEDLTSSGDSLMYLDRSPSATVWKIDSKGLASLVASVADLPATMTAPVSDARGRLFTLAATGQAFNDTDPTDEVTALLARNKPSAHVQYPALLIIDGPQRTTIGLDQWNITPGLNLASWSTPRLFIDRGHLLAYDPAAGELIRLRMD